MEGDFLGGARHTLAVEGEKFHFVTPFGVCVALRAPKMDNYLPAAISIATLDWAFG
jgi:hypothetical protein